MDAPWWDKSHQAFESTKFWKTASGATRVALTEVIDSQRRRVVVYDVDGGGAPLFAWGGDGCVASVRSYEDQLLMLVANTGAAVGYDIQLWWGTPAALQAASSPSFAFKFSDPGFAEFGNATLGDGVLGWEVTSVHLMNLATKAQVQIVPTPVSAASIVRFLGPTLFFQSSPAPTLPFWRAWVAPDGGTPAVLVAPSSAHVRGLDTDGAKMGWLQLANQTSASPEKYAVCDLYSAPHTASPGAVQGTRLTKVDLCTDRPPWVHTQVHNGFFGMESGTGQFGDRVYSLSDGSYRLAPTAPVTGMVNSQQLWADDKEIVVQASDAVYQRPLTIVRLPLADLPLKAPTP
jgi:hypothetical protein